MRISRCASPVFNDFPTQNLEDDDKTDSKISIFPKRNKSVEFQGLLDAPPNSNCKISKPSDQSDDHIKPSPDDKPSIDTICRKNNDTKEIKSSQTKIDKQKSFTGENSSACKIPFQKKNTDLCIGSRKRAETLVSDNLVSADQRKAIEDLEDESVKS